jgi:hypothetical protein
MSSRKTKPPGLGFGEGHVATYTTLAEGLRQAAEAREVDIAYLEKKGLPISANALRIEARCATITLLSAAVCECAANTILATVLSEIAFVELEKERPPMPRKWSHSVPEALKCTPPTDALMQELWLLYRTRDSVVHSKPTVFSDGENVRVQGNDSQWVHLTPEAVRKFVTLPIRVAQTIPESAEPLIQAIGWSLKQRQPRLPRVHVAEVLELLELLTAADRQDVRRRIDYMEALRPSG